MQPPLTVPDLITTIGAAAIAREFGHENVSTVSSWKARGAIPVAYWPKLVEIAAAAGVEGVTYDALVHAHAKPTQSDPSA